MKTKSLALWLTALGPLALLALGLVYGAWQELHAWQQVRQVVLAEVSQAKREHGPRSARQVVTANDRVADIGQIKLLTAALRDQTQSYDLASLGSNAPLAMPGDIAAWPEAPLVGKLMADAEPMFKKLEQLFNARDDSRDLALGLAYSGVHELLETSFRYSVFSDDSTGAQRALTLMAQLTIFDSADLDATWQRHYLPRYVRVYELFGESLAHDPWSAAQLDTLAELILRPLEISERLDASHRNQQRAIVSWILHDHGAELLEPSQFKWSPSTDSVYLLRILDASRRPDAITDVNDLTKSIPLLERPRQIRRAGAFAITVPFDGGQKYVGSLPEQTPMLAFVLGVAEDARRLISLAVATKRFQLEHERWPKSLDQLLADQENRELVITDVSGRRFDYSVVSKAADPDMPPHAVLSQSRSEFREAEQRSVSESGARQRTRLRDLPAIPSISWLSIR